MDRLLIVCFLTFASQLTYGHKDLIFDKNKFLGIQIGKTTFEEANKILNHRSFKKSDSLFTSIRFRYRPSAILIRLIYYIEVNGTKLEVKLKGYTTVDYIQVTHIDGETISFKNITLGKTTVKEINKEHAQDWNLTTNRIERDSILTTNYKNIQIGVDLTTDKDDFAGKKIKYLILEKGESKE